MPAKTYIRYSLQKGKYDQIMELQKAKLLINQNIR